MRSIYGVHGTLFDRLGLTISTQKSVLKKKHRVMRYCPKYVEIWTFGSKSQFLTHISWFLWTHCIVLKTGWCVETVSPSRSKRVPWTPKTERNYFWPLKGPCWTYFGIFQWRFRHKTPLDNTDSLIFVSINRIHLRFIDFPTFSIFNPPYPTYIMMPLLGSTCNCGLPRT